MPTDTSLTAPMRPGAVGSFGSWAGRCIHFAGMYDPGMVPKTHCKAGIAFAEVKAQNGGKLPCLGREDAECASFRYPTSEEVRQWEADTKAAVNDFFGKIEAGICPHCGTAIQRKEQVGRCVYARPCGHRLYQGRNDTPL